MGLTPTLKATKETEALQNVTRLECALRLALQPPKVDPETIREIEVIVTTTDGKRRGKTYDKNLREVASWP